MTLPIVWSGLPVDPANLQDTVAGPWSRVVDKSLSGNTGRNYTNLQDAWNAADAGDSIFVKAGAYAGGLVVSSGAGNTKNGMRVVGESTDAVTFGSTIQIHDCDDLRLENLTTEATAGDGFSFETIERYHFDRLISRAAGVDGFEAAQLKRGTWVACMAVSAVGRGFVMHDQMQRNTWLGCLAESCGSNAWSIGAFPTVNSWCVRNEFVACKALDSTGSGNGFALTIGSPVSGAKGWQHTALIGCNSAGNAGDGYQFTNIGSANPNGLRVVGCDSMANGSFGYRFTGAPATFSTFSFNGNTHAGNASGGYSGAPATRLPGYVGSGLTAPGTNT